ncbi:MAG: M3 family metallopeptidase, partial [Bdellovibrionales bacterium]|nr:M3 family metallopeptidase [Bdellovibrionales bacterium]
AHGKDKLREIDRKLARLTHEFSDNVLKDTNAYQLLVTDPKDVEGIPASALEDAAHTAEKKGHKGAWMFTLQFPSYHPFQQHCENAALREKMWRAYMGRGTSHQADNRPVLREIATLRHQRARLLGYPTHAHYVLEERMAQNPETVDKFLRDFNAAVLPAGRKDFEELRALKKELYPGGGDLKPWDTILLAEKLRQRKYDFSEEELRSYFPLESVIRGVFTVAEKLYGLEFKPRDDVPVYHPDVRVFDVLDARKEFLGLFYCDFFPRESKKSGAWMTSFRDQGTQFGKKVRPWVSIVGNFTKPTASQPSLLTMNEVKTLFHEFGHALHGLLSRCTYASLSGTNVFWDFVELPSQFMENFTGEKECLDLFASHYKTGEKMPKELIQKLKDARAFLAGLMGVRQTAFSLLDMAWHGRDPSGIEDTEAFEAQAVRDASFFPHIPGTSVSPGFSHIFAGGYSAGYYSYKWAEVLDADAFEYFREEGVFNRQVADRFRENVLERGGTEPPMELYKRFRGREPDPRALLRRDGLIQQTH